MALVAIVRHVSENDVVRLDGLPDMEYDAALAVMRNVVAVKPAFGKVLDLCYVTDDGQLGRYASWVL